MPKRPGTFKRTCIQCSEKKPSEEFEERDIVTKCGITKNRVCDECDKKEEEAISRNALLKTKLMVRNQQLLLTKNGEWDGVFNKRSAGLG